MATATVNRKNPQDGSGETRSDVSAADVEAQIEQIRKDIATLTKTVAAFGSGKAGELGGKADKARSDLMKSSQQALDEVRAEVSSLETDLKNRVRRNPLQAIGIAAAAGFVVAMMTRH